MSVNSFMFMCIQDNKNLNHKYSIANIYVYFTPENLRYSFSGFSHCMYHCSVSGKHHIISYGERKHVEEILFNYRWKV